VVQFVIANGEMQIEKFDFCDGLATAEHRAERGIYAASTCEVHRPKACLDGSGKFGWRSGMNAALLVSFKLYSARARLT
jgi:hypothetical protein